MLKIFQGTDKTLINKQIADILTQEGLKATISEDPTRARQQCSSNGLLGERIAIILDADLKELNWTKKQISVLVSTRNLLLIRCSNWKENSKVGKLLTPYLTKLELPGEWKGKDIKSAIAFYGRRHGLNLSFTVIDYLKEALNNNFAVLDNRLATIALLTDNPSLELVKELVPSQYATAIQLKELILAKNKREIYLCADKLAGTIPDLAVIGSLATQFTTLMQTAIGIKQGLEEREIARLAGISNVKRLYYLKQDLKGISLERLIWLNREIEQCRYQIMYGNCNLKGKLLYLSSW